MFASSLIVLHSHHLPLDFAFGSQRDRATSTSEIGLQSAVRMVLDMCRSSNETLGSRELGSLTPQAMSCMFQACLMYIYMHGEDLSEPRERQELDIMKTCLEYFAKRWEIGSKSVPIFLLLHYSGNNSSTQYFI